MSQLIRKQNMTCVFKTVYSCTALDVIIQVCCKVLQCYKSIHNTIIDDVYMHLYVHNET